MLLTIGGRRASAQLGRTRDGAGWTGRLAAIIGVAHRASDRAGVFVSARAIRIFVAARPAAARSRTRASEPGAAGTGVIASSSEIAAATGGLTGPAHHRAARGRAAFPGCAAARLPRARRSVGASV